MNAALIGWCVVFAGAAVVAVCALAATALSGIFDRLHLLAVATSLGVPVTGAGLVIVRGWTAASAMIAVITALVVLTAPVMSAATGRLAAGHEGIVDETPPT